MLAAPVGVLALVCITHRWCPLCVHLVCLSFVMLARAPCNAHTVQRYMCLPLKMPMVYTAAVGLRSVVNRSKGERVAQQFPEALKMDGRLCRMHSRDGKGFFSEPPAHDADMAIEVSLPSPRWESPGMVQAQATPALAVFLLKVPPLPCARPKVPIVDT